MRMYANINEHLKHLWLIVVLFVLVTACASTNLKQQTAYVQNFNVVEYNDATEYVVENIVELYNKEELTSEEVKRFQDFADIYGEFSKFYNDFTRYQFNLSSAISSEDFDSLTELNAVMIELKERWGLLLEQLKAMGYKSRLEGWEFP